VTGKTSGRVIRQVEKGCMNPGDSWVTGSIRGEIRKEKSSFLWEGEELEKKKKKTVKCNRKMVHCDKHDGGGDILGEPAEKG